LSIFFSLFHIPHAFDSRRFSCYHFFVTF